MVLVPGWPLPMRIFEPRYLQLLADQTSPGAAGRFGVVALTAGFEVQSKADRAVPPQFARIGTVAEILEVSDPDPDGTVQLLAGGSQRFRVQRIVESDKPYLVAEVTMLRELDGDVPDGLETAVHALSAELLRLLHELTASDHPVEERYPDDLALLAHRLAGEAPLSHADQLALLEHDTAADRLRHLQRLFRRELAIMRRTHTVAARPAQLNRVVAPN